MRPSIFDLNQKPGDNPRTTIINLFLCGQKTRCAQGETTMKTSRLLGIAVALCVATPLALAGTALAQKPKKLTYEQAWTASNKEVSLLGGEGTTSAGRYTRGAACMKQHGYRLKKSSMAGQ